MDKNINLKNKIIYPFIGLIFPCCFFSTPSNVVVACITSDNFFLYRQAQARIF